MEIRYRSISSLANDLGVTYDTAINVVEVSGVKKYKTNKIKEFDVPFLRNVYKLKKVSGCTFPFLLSIKSSLLHKLVEEVL